MSIIISRQKAITKGLTQYFTGKPCKHGHISNRTVNGHRCIKCSMLWHATWASQNREKFLLGKNKWAQENPEKKKTLNKKWRAANLGRAREIARLSNLKNHERIKVWRTQNAQLIRSLNWKRKAALRNIPGSFSATEINELFQKQKGQCAICFSNITLLPKQKNTAHKDHIIPLFYRERSSNYISNIQLLCRACNLRKWRHLPETSNTAVAP